MERLDTYEDLPRGMREYLSHNGWHFNRGMFDWATSKMRSRNGQKLQVTSKEDVDAQLRNVGVTLKNDVLYDAAYVYNMAMADYYGSSLKDAGSVAVFVRDYLDDVDGTRTRAMDEFVGKCIGAGCPIPWEDALYD